jgi:hypothetical protein
VILELIGLLQNVHDVHADDWRQQVDEHHTFEDFIPVA